MEGRLLYFPSKVEPVKRLFFSTATGKGVVSQIVFLPSPDQFGRGGRYLAHSLVFSPEALAQFEADPFRALARFPFVTTVDAALQAGDFQTGNIPPVTLDLPQKRAIDVEAAGHWSPTELKKLALLALRVEQQARQREALTVTGQPEEVEAALAAAFGAIFVKRVPLKPIPLQAWMGLVSAPPLLVASLVFERGQIAASLDGGVWFLAALAFTVLAVNVFGHGSFYFLLKRYDASLVAPLTLIAPVIGVVLGVAVAGDPLTWRLALGGALALSGVAVVAARRARTVPPELVLQKPR